MMAEITAQFAEAQDVARSTHTAIYGMVITQFVILQRLGEVQYGIFNQAVQLIGDQLQLMGRVPDPREFAFAQADLLMSHGHRYVDSVRQAVDVIAKAWLEYGERLENGASAAAVKRQRAA